MESEPLQRRAHRRAVVIEDRGQEEPFVNDLIAQLVCQEASSGGDLGQEERHGRSCLSFSILQQPAPAGELVVKEPQVIGCGAMDLEHTVHGRIVDYVRPGRSASPPGPTHGGRSWPSTPSFPTQL
ncbi:MAG: hypothetical protein ACRDX8_09095 [Acidimicrobiales bacterium]